MTFFPRCTPSACERPTVVVVLPSPSGVGVMAVTSTYLPLGRFARRSKISSLTLALYGPYSSSSSGRMPSSSATCVIGFSLASCAISISEGTGRRNLSLVGANLRTTFLFTAAFFTAALFFTGFFALTLVGIFAPLCSPALLSKIFFVLTIAVHHCFWITNRPQLTISLFTKVVHSNSRLALFDMDGLIIWCILRV